MIKQIHVGDRVWVTIKFVDGKLSITGVDKPTRFGNAESCGQINDFEVEKLAPNWTKLMVRELKEVWKKWHRQLY